VQALKAGIMEIADIFVVNKADREGADRTAASIEAMLSLDSWPSGKWRPPVLRTVATTGAGLPELVATIDRFRSETKDELGRRRRTRAEWRLREVLGRSFMRHVEEHVLAPGEFDRLLDRIANRDIDPYGAAEGVMAKSGHGPGGASAGFEAAPLDHVGIAVRDASEYAALFDRLFGLPTGPSEDVGLHRLRFVETGPAGSATLELIEPLSPESPIGKFLDARGAGLHHICLLVKDIDAALAALKAKGVRLIDETPRTGAHGSRIAFLHPSSANGLLIEIKQPAS
jgi:methylmalonyl-CoA epimerase